MHKKLFIVFILWLFSLETTAQSLAGVWKGRIETGSSEAPYELVISGEGDKISGYSLIVFTFNGVENIGVKSVKLKNKKGNVSLEDGDLIYDNYSTPPRKVKFFANMFLKTSENMMVLSGTFQTRSLDMRVTDSYNGTIWLQKQADTSVSKLVAKLKDLNLAENLSFLSPENKKTEPLAKQRTVSQKEDLPVTPGDSEKMGAKETTTAVALANKKTASANPEPVAEIIKPAAAVTTRKTEVIQSIFFTNDSLVLSLYDNGEIDGDTVSVVLNSNVVIAKKGLTSNPVKTVVHLSRNMGDSVQLIMYAENLGRIPPNTGVLILEDGNTRHEIRFAGDLQKNSAVVLRRRKTD